MVVDVLDECMYFMIIMEHIGTRKVKFIASQARTVNLYKNLRSKLLKCCANIFFNRQCLRKKIIPKYVNIKVANTSPAAQTTTSIHVKIDILSNTPYFNNIFVTVWDPKMR